MSSSGKAAGGGTGVAAYCRLTKSAVQLIVHGAAAAVVTFDGEAEDTDNFHDNAVNPGRITIPPGKAGVYLVGGAVQWDTPPSDSQLFLRVNGAAIIPGGSREGATAAGMGNMLAAQPVRLGVGDTVELMVQNSDGANDRNVRGVAGSQVSASFHATLIGT